jgi:hypothetical protein
MDIRLNDALELVIIFLKQGITKDSNGKTGKIFSL